MEGNGIMSTKFRTALAMVLLLLAVGSVSACADIHPDNTPHSPVFRG
jgi:hypothetical protein